jgi:hypothetical protein
MAAVSPAASFACCGPEGGALARSAGCLWPIHHLLRIAWFAGDRRLGKVMNARAAAHDAAAHPRPLERCLHCTERTQSMGWSRGGLISKIQRESKLWPVESIFLRMFTTIHRRSQGAVRPLMVRLGRRSITKDILLRSFASVGESRHAMRKSRKINNKMLSALLIGLEFVEDI